MKISILSAVVFGLAPVATISPASAQQPPNQFDGGAVHIHKAGDSWWEAPGTVHDTARNASATARARLLVVYVGEVGKTATVPIK